MFSAIILNKRSYAAVLLYKTAAPPAVHLSRSSRTKVRFFQFSSFMADRDQTVLQRFKPNSRTTFIGEQPNPWNLVQLQDVMSRHRGAKRLRQ